MYNKIKNIQSIVYYNIWECLWSFFLIMFIKIKSIIVYDNVILIYFIDDIFIIIDINLNNIHFISHWNNFKLIFICLLFRFNFFIIHISTIHREVNFHLKKLKKETRERIVCINI